MNFTFNSEQERDNFLKTRIESANFTRGVLNALFQVNIRTLGGIVKRSTSELSDLLNFSKAETDKIKAKVEHFYLANKSETASILTDTTPETSESSIPESISLSDFGGEDDIVETLSEYFGHNKEDIIRHSRRKEIVDVRDLVVYLLREYGEMSYPAIGRLLGGRDHTTIIHSYKKTKERIAKNPDSATKLEDLINKVKAIKERKLRIETDLIPEILAYTGSEHKGSSSQPVYREVPPRSTKMLELWREGLTLQNIANVFSVSRERVRQIIVHTIKQMAVNESVTKGIVMDSTILVEEEAKKRKSVQEAKKVSNSPAQKVIEKRWSRYYPACRSCGTTAIPHVRKGLCERCIGSYRSDRRESIISNHKNKCDSCGVERYKAQALYGRDFYITKNQGVLCRRCFLSRTGTKLGNRIRTRR